MKKTRVDIYFNGASVVYFFQEDKQAFMSVWNNHIPAVGYYTGVDEKGDEVIINPSNCAVIEIKEVDA